MTARLAYLPALPAVVSLALLPVLIGRAPEPPTGVAAAPAALQDKDPEAAATCGQCHTEIYEEWKGRTHSKAWDDPVYQEAIKKKRRPRVCHSCHIPYRVLDRLGRKPKTRKKLLHEGVTCVACHQKGETIHGPFGAKTDAHPTEKDPTFTESGVVHLCSSCHATKIGPVLPLARDFTRSDFQEKEKKTCVSCHMPQVERHVAVSIVTGKPVGEKRLGRRHTVLGPNDPEFCAKAFAIEARKDGAEVVVAIANKAGHRVPGLKLRTFPVDVVQLGADGKELATGRIEISADNEIKVLETREFRFELADGASELKVVVDHAFEGEKVATILTEKFPL